MSKHAKLVARNAATSHEFRPAVSDPNEVAIAALAYQLWLERGCPNGSDQDDWFRAVGMLRSRSEVATTALAVSA